MYVTFYGVRVQYHELVEIIAGVTSTKSIQEVLSSLNFINGVATFNDGDAVWQVAVLGSMYRDNFDAVIGISCPLDFNTQLVAFDHLEQARAQFFDQMSQSEHVVTLNRHHGIYFVTKSGLYPQAQVL